MAPITILVYYQSAGLGGQQTQLLHLCEEFVKQGHKIVFAYEYGSDLLPLMSKYSTIIKIDVIKKEKQINRMLNLRYFMLFINTVLRIGSVYKIIKKHNISLVVSSDSYSSLVCGIGSNIAKFRGRPKQFRMIGQDIELLEYPWFKLYQVMHIDKFVDKYFGWDKVYRSLEKKGVSKRKFASFQNNAVNIHKYIPLSHEARMELRARLSIPKDHIVIGWVGRLEERMQVKHTIELARVLKGKGLDKFTVLIVGGGRLNSNGIEDISYPSKLRELVNKYEISSQVIFTGWVNQELVPEYLNSMDVVPLLEEDPQGGSILREAMSCGRVALSVDGVSGVQRTFMNPECTILVDPEDFIEKSTIRIQELANDLNEIESLGQNARNYCMDNLTFKKQAEDIMKCY